MDEAVRRAMARWPDVPAVFGWLALDARGRWLIRGEPVVNPLLNDFIGRNYAADRHGRWYFQNGPQRVFVTLACTPWVLRVDAAGRFQTHTGVAVSQIRASWMDRDGRLIVSCEHGAGLVDDRDSETISRLIVDARGSAADEDALIESLDRVQAGASAPVRLECAGSLLPIEPIAADQLPSTLGFIADPKPLPGERVGS